MQVYKFPKLRVICNFALAGIIYFGGLVMGLIGLIADKPLGGRIMAGLFLSVWLSFGVWKWYVILYKVPWAVEWADEGFLVFRSVMGSTKVAVKDIISIKEVALFGGPPSIKFQHTGGTIKLPTGRLIGFAELLDRVLAINPTVELSLYFGY